MCQMGNVSSHFVCTEIPAYTIGELGSQSPVFQFEHKSQALGNFDQVELVIGVFCHFKCNF